MPRPAPIVPHATRANPYFSDAISLHAMKPQPDVLGAVVSESVHPGKTSLIVSLIAMPLGATKLYVIAVAEPRMGVAITRALSSRPTITASDVMIETSGALAQFTMVTAIVYPELSADTAMSLMAAAFVVSVYAVFKADHW